MADSQILSEILLRESHLGAQQVSRLLETGKAGKERPARFVDELIEPLSTRWNDPTWIERLLEAELPEGRGRGALVLANAKASLDEINAIKRASKRAFRDGKDKDLKDLRLAGTAGYFLAVAAGLAFHGEYLSSRPREEISEVLMDLAAVTPGEWTELLMKALEALGAGK